MPKYGGPGKARQKCIKRQCLRLSRILYTEDPLQSGSSPALQQDMAAELMAVGGGVTLEGLQEREVGGGVESAQSDQSKQ